MSKLYPFQSRRPYSARLTDKKHVPYLTEAGTLTAYGVPAFATRWGRQTSAYSAPKDAYILPSGVWVETADHVPARAGEHGAEYDGAPAAGHAWHAIAAAAPWTGPPRRATITHTSSTRKGEHTMAHDIYHDTGRGAYDVDGIRDAFDDMQDLDEIAESAREQFGDDAEDVAAEIAALRGLDPDETREKTHKLRLLWRTAEINAASGQV
jgi:hypothetical protein